MDREHLVDLGKELIQELRIRAENFNDRSSQYEELSWESVGVETRIGMLERGDLEPLKKEALRDNNWGQCLLAHSPRQAEKVIDFIRSFTEFSAFNLNLFSST